MTLEQRRALWKQGTPGPLKVSVVPDLLPQIIDTDGWPIADFNECHQAGGSPKANAQRFADSVYLETLVAALERIVELPIGSDRAAPYEIAREALNSLSDPEAK